MSSAAALLLTRPPWLPAGFVAPEEPTEEEPPPPPPPPPDPEPTEYDRVVQNETLTGIVEIPAGERWYFGAGVVAHMCHLVVRGESVGRAGSFLRVTGGDRTLYRGNAYVHPDGTPSNGLVFNATDYPYDFGIWVEKTGKWDWQGTPKVAWNRTGIDPSWDLDNDELWIAPTAFGDYAPRRWYSGDPIPTVTDTNPATGEVYERTAEIMNVTRDCVITVDEGATFHFHAHCHNHPVTMKYVRLNGLGVSNMEHEGPVTGRYALHLHHSAPESAGHQIVGSALTNTRGRGYVPHGSHGILFDDCVAVNSFAEAFWWDANTEADRTTNVIVRRMCVSGVRMPKEVSGKSSGHSAMQLPGGENMLMEDCACSGVPGTSAAHGFDWPSSADNHGVAVWDFRRNVAHNIGAQGIRLWFNNPKDHTMEDSFTYHCKDHGFVNGAYRNAHRWIRMVCVQDAMQQHASSEFLASDPTQTALFEDCVILNRANAKHKYAFSTGSMNVPASRDTLVLRGVYRSSPGYPSFLMGVKNMENPFRIRLRHVKNGLGQDVTPADVYFYIAEDGSYGNTIGQYPAMMAGSVCYIEHPDGRSWEIRPNMTTHQMVVTQLT